MAIKITKRARNSIRNLYWESTRKSIQRRLETKSLVDAMTSLINTTPIIPSKNTNGVLKLWIDKGYSIFETTHVFIRQSTGIRCKEMSSKRDINRKWYFACVNDLPNDEVYIVNAVYAKYIDRMMDDTPTALRFLRAMKGVQTRRRKKEAQDRQLNIPFQESVLYRNKSHERLTQIINEEIHRVMSDCRPIRKRQMPKETKQFWLNA